MTWLVIFMVEMLCLALNFNVNLFVFVIGFVSFSLKFLLWSFVTFHDYEIRRGENKIKYI